MKKMFTLLFATAMLSTAFAQYEQRDRQDWNKDNDGYKNNDNRGYDNHDNGNRGYNKHNNGYRNGYFFTARERDMQIEHITHDYEHRIEAVRNQYFMSWYQKKRQIMFLEEQRDNEIHEVIHRFNDRRNQFGDNGRGKRNKW